MTAIWEVVTRARGVDAEARLLGSESVAVRDLGEKVMFEGRRWTVQSASPCGDPRAKGRIVLVPVEESFDIASTPTRPTTQLRPARA